MDRRKDGQLDETIIKRFALLFTIQRRNSFFERNYMTFLGILFTGFLREIFDRHVKFNVTLNAKIRSRFGMRLRVNF